MYTGFMRANIFFSSVKICQFLLGRKDGSVSKGIAVQPDDLTWISGAHLVEGENELQQSCPLTCTHTLQ